MDQSLLDLLDSTDNSSNLGSWLTQLDLSTSNEQSLADLQVYQYPVIDPVSIAKDLQLPVDPHNWDTSHVLRWVEWTLRQSNTDDVENWRIREQLRLQSINGDHLTKWSAFEYDRIFNYSSEYLRQQMTNWLQALHTSDGYPVTTDDFFVGQAQPEYENEYNNNMNTIYNDPYMYQPLLNNNTMNATGQEDYVVNYDPNYHHMSFTHQRTPEYLPYTWTQHEDDKHYSVTTKREPMNSGSSESGESSSDDDDDEEFVPTVIGTTRTPPTVTKRRHPILYKFILEHLNDPSISHGYVEWVNKSEGLFRFNSRRKDKFAEMWSKAKGKKQPMTYQNMARALRNYTRPNKKIMERVPKKLHYKFVPEFIV